FILVDLPPEEAHVAQDHFRPRGIDMVYLIAPTTTDARIRKIAAAASGYLYYVSLKGVTGAANLDIDSVQAKLETIRNITSLPVTVGFGIKDAATAAAVGSVAQGVVVGSALVSKVAELQHSPDRILSDVPPILADMRKALDALK
ncbi:MAG TPA: tryptophan synthase subunit alpha, partial [Pseudomonadales bacterium]|nr:tryptophan synthase subunit alpha [Pseudomonadales bacterium]